MSEPRKFFIDSRARKSGEHSHFTWQCDRPISVETARCFIDAVHIPQVFGTINSTNQHVYITEEQADFTILQNHNKLYISEENGNTTTQTIVTALSLHVTL